MRPLLVLTSTAAAIVLGCTTTQPAATSTIPRTSALAAQPTAPASADDDVAVLKERVSRLERRLADVDAKLGLLLAQRSSPRPQSRSIPAETLGPRELIADAPPKEEASLGARAIDLSTRKSSYDDQQEPVVVKNEEDTGPPIVIKVVGDSQRDTVVERPVASTKQVRAPESATQLEEPTGLSVRDQYEWAQAKMKEGKLDDAIHVFEEIASRHSHHDLADNAIYWVAYCKQMKGDHRGAVDSWQKLPMRFPKSAKIPDALFGMAVSEEALGEPAVAETLYEQLVSQYPRAEKVRDAKHALERLRPR